MSDSKNITEMSLEGLLDEATPSLKFLAPAQQADELGRLSHYRVLKVLGQGGMGIVFAAEDLHLQRTVALKVMRSDLGDSLGRQRFLREARAMAQVKSDHVVAIHEVGQVDDLCFLAMELLEGEPLDRWLDRTGIPPLGEALRIGREIALALAAAHGRGLIHRDVKPANVWLEAPNRRVKLLDFGLARPLDADVGLTGYGMVVGTPMYMAPEQARAKPLDGRADLFSLGCLLYRMTAGRLAFEGNTPLEVMTAIVGHDPPPVSQFQPAVPASLNQLIVRLLAKEPSARPASAEVTSIELEAIAQSLTNTGFSIGQTSPSSLTPPTPILSPVPGRSSVESSQSRRRPRDAERRQVTVLAGGCDLFESEAFLGLDSEDQAQIVAAFQQACHAAIAPFDGAMVQCSEQGLLACFGFPTAHEDAASRAAQAGLRLLEEVKTLSANLQRSYQLEAKVWAGVHTGPAIVEVKENAIALVGEARNVAVRLKEAMSLDRVICTEASHRLFKGGFHCTEIGPRTFGGVPRPLTLYTIVGVAASSGELSIAIPAVLSPLVGRDHEVSLLKDRWERAQDGMSQVVFLVGEPGLGKSRLVITLQEFVQQQLADEADSPIVEWRCSPHYQNTSLHPAIDFFERTLGFRPEEPLALRFDRLLERLVHDGLARPDLIPLWASLLSVPAPDRFPRLSLSPARQREETFRLILDWLHLRADRAPVLFIVEDLHWADASTLEFLGQFLVECERNRILAVFTFRPEFKPPWPAAEAQTILSLARLTRRQAGDLMRKKTGGNLAEAVIEQVYERVGGVPLFIEEFTKVVQEAEAQDATKAADASAVLARGIPSTLQDLVMARLDRMEGGREIALLGAVIGREFTYALLAAVTPCDDATLQAELANLTRAEIVHAKGRPPECTYVFKHALLVDALYGSLMKARRQQLHRAVAEALETRVCAGRRDASRITGPPLHRSGPDRAGHSLLARGGSAFSRTVGPERSNRPAHPRARAPRNARTPNRARRVGATAPHRTGPGLHRGSRLRRPGGWSGPASRPRTLPAHRRPARPVRRPARHVGMANRPRQPLPLPRSGRGRDGACRAARRSRHAYGSALHAGGHHVLQRPIRRRPRVPGQGARRLRRPRPHEVLDRAHRPRRRRHPPLLSCA